MTVPTNSSQTWRAAFTGSYDDEEIALLLPYIGPSSLVLDVGASIGFYAVPFGLAARRTGSRVLAVEPIEANCATIRRNVSLNGLAGTVEVLPVALGGRREEVLLHVETGGTGNATIVSGLDPAEIARHDKAGGTGSTQVAQVCRLDDLDPPANRPGERCSLMKIDAEGFEIDVLNGGSSFVATHRPVIFGEFHPDWLKTRGMDPAAPTLWAANHDYDCSELVHRRANTLLDRQRISLRPLGIDSARSGTSLLLTPRN